MDGFDLRAMAGGFELWFAGRLLLRHSAEQPCLALGRGGLRVDSHLGHFRLYDEAEWSYCLHTSIDDDGIEFIDGRGQKHARILLRNEAIVVEPLDPDACFIELAFHAEPDEHVWGGGEQFSFLDLSGRAFPLWVGEPGVGRDPHGELAGHMVASPLRAGDYWTTNYPQPTFLTSRLLALHVETAAYVHADFTHADRHKLRCYDARCRIEFFAADDMPALVSRLSERFGRPAPLPDWAIEGAIIGLKDGERSFERLDRIVEAGAVVTGLWCEDRAGIRQTDFGRRLF